MTFLSFGFNLLVYFIIPVISLSCWWIQKRFSFWKDRNVPGPEPTWKFLAGNMTGVGSKVNMVSRLHDIYNEYKNKSPAVGIFMSVSPSLLVTDPELVKTILVKDFAKFHDHGLYFNERDDPLSAHLFNLEGAKWKFFRNKLSPTFTSGKMKLMYSSIEQIGDRFIEVLDKHAKDQSSFDVKDLSMRFTTDVVGSTAFGIEVNCLGSETVELFGVVKKLFDAFNFTNFSVLFKFTFQDLARKLRLPLMPPDAAAYFMNMLKQTVDYREQNRVVRHDFLHLLLQLKNKGFLDDETGDEDAEKMTFNQIAAQAFIFFFAGFETSSTAMNFTLYELALHQDIQEKARREIEEKIAKHDGKLTYDALMDMEYLNQVFNESLRLHPPVFILTRKATQDYIIPNTNMKIDKGTQVIIPNHALQLDPQHFPDPEKFDPERFSKGNIEARHQFVFLPFGEGPRICIGNRFAQLQSRFAIALMLKNFKLTVNEKTKIPLEFVPDFPGWMVVGGTWLNVERI